MNTLTLPLEIMVYITSLSPESFRSMLAIPLVIRYLTSENEKHMLPISKEILNDDNHNIKKYSLWGKLHRIDGPAYKDCLRKLWCQGGKLHRSDGPAFMVRVRHHNILHWWFHNGRLHRDNDQPAKTRPDLNYAGDEWYQNGLRHRDNGPARVGNIEKWYQYGKLHREDGPAVIHTNGTKEWFWRGLRHRGEDLPAGGAPEAEGRALLPAPARQPDRCLVRRSRAHP